MSHYATLQFLTIASAVVLGNTTSTSISESTTTSSTSASSSSSSASSSSPSSLGAIPALLQSSLSRHLVVSPSIRGAQTTNNNDRSTSAAQQQEEQHDQQQQLHHDEEEQDIMALSSCQSDMMELERNTDLSESLQSVLNSFSSDFDSNPLQYCSSSSTTIQSSSAGGRQLDCFVDFDKFSLNYKSVCRDFEAEYFPISLFMQCSSSKSDVNLEMELANIPTCLAHQCDRVEVGIALDRLLSESNGSSSTFSGYSCILYKKTNQLYQVTSAATTTTTSRGTIAIATATVLFGMFNLVVAFGL
jgi:hypothetical protein